MTDSIAQILFAQALPVFLASGVATALVEAFFVRGNAFSVANEQEHVRRRHALIERLVSLVNEALDEVDRHNDIPAPAGRGAGELHNDLARSLALASLYLSSCVLEPLGGVLQLVGHYDDPNFVPPKVEPDFDGIRKLLIEAAAGKHRA